MTNFYGGDTTKQRQTGVHNVNGRSVLLDETTGDIIRDLGPATGSSAAAPHSVAEDIAIAATPRTTNSTSSSTSSSTSLNSTPFAISTNSGVYIYDPLSKTTSLIPGSDRMSAAEQQQYATQWNIANLNAQTSRQNTATTEGGANQRNAANIGATASEGAATRGLTTSENALNRADTAAGRAFTAGESLLSRAQQAGEFAANYAITKANAERQQKADQLNAADVYSKLSGSADLTGYQRFLDAGGGVLGNSIAARARSITPQGQLGAARALQTATTPATPIPEYVNPYAGIDLTKNPYLNQPAATAAPTMDAGAARGMLVSRGLDPFSGQPLPTNTATTTAPATAAPALTPAQQANQQLDAARGPNGETVPSWVTRYALGTRPPQLGTMRREPITASPNGGSMDGLTDRYATGTFISGDSTDPNDPAAGGAHPEQVTLEDPPGPDNARAEVDPLTPPGVGDTSGDDGSIGALLIAIGKFLSAQESPEPSPPSAPSLLGAMGKPRFALGTDMLTPEDQPYLDQVLQTRQSTPFSVNPYAIDYMQQSPTKRAIDAAAFQTATGVPGSEVAFENQRYAPGGLARGSIVSRELDTGF